MANFGKTFGLLLGLTLIAVLGWGAYLGLDFTVSLFEGLDAQVAKVTAIASAVVLAGAAIIASAVRKGGAKNQAAQVREQKTGVYQYFVECWQDPATAQHKHLALDRLLALHGSGSVVRAHMALRAIAREKGARHPDATAQLGKVLLEIRKDLGGDAAARGIGAAELSELVLASPAPAGVHAGSERTA
jgi:hypothetical protein